MSETDEGLVNDGASVHVRDEGFTDNARLVLERRYLRKGSDGRPVETIEGMFRRISGAVAGVESEWGDDVDHAAQAFHELMSGRLFFPNSPTFTGAGTPLGQLAACFVLPIADDMGRETDGIFSTLRNAALIQQTGGGNGFSFSRLRPSGAFVQTSAGRATGPVGFLQVYDKAFGEIAQGGSRRGANMAVLRVDHPDIMDFIRCKAVEGQMTNFNISVGITDAFMRAVEADEMFDLVAPHDGQVCATLAAREIFDEIVRHAFRNGEPGVLFLDTANRANPLPHLYELEATNPCGEQWLGPYENCCLGSINLAQHTAPGGRVDWDKLERTVELSTRFLDDVVSANRYVPAVPELREAALRSRRIGLGIMGLADMMFHSGVPYGSSAGEEFAGQIMEFVRYHCMRTSIELARSRGPFPSVSGSIYDPEEATWQVPTPLEPYTQDWGRPELDWQAIVDGIRVHGVRNAAQTTVAPTGTIATVADCEGYGCEPAFALAYTRYMRDGQQVVPLLYTSPLFERALIEAGIQAERRREIAEQVSVTGSCRHVAAIPDHIRNVFVVAGDITPDQHVRMQAAIQAFVDNSISKTCNFPPEATEEDVKRAYFMAWKLGCKGLTVYVTGTREEVVLETEATRRAKQDARGNGQSAGLLPPESLAMPRPDVLKGMTYRVMTPHGKAFVTVNEGPDSEPFEVFMTVGKAGSDIFALSEALGRLISLVLRLPSTLGQRQKVSEIVNQLSGIGGRLSYGHGPRRVRSLPDGIAGVLGRYALRPDGDDGHQLSETVAAAARSTVVERNGGGAVQDDSSEFIIGDLCPDCGHTTLVRTEGCRKCVAHGCGYTEC